MSMEKLTTEQQYKWEQVLATLALEDLEPSLYACGRAREVLSGEKTEERAVEEIKGRLPGRNLTGRSSVRDIANTGSTDVYSDPDTGVLKNKENIQDKRTLSHIEADLACIRLAQLQKKPVRGSFDFKHLCRIHHTVFQDLYPWAGKVRTVNIAKGNLFCLVQHLSAYAESIFPVYSEECLRVKDQPEVFVPVFTRHYADLNALHPFREGNGRAQREFARELCLKCGYTFDLRHTNHKEMVEASIQSMSKGDNTGLEAIFQKAIRPL